MSTNIKDDVKVENKEKIKKPKNKEIVYFNDDVTDVFFVISSLIEVFDMSEQKAHNIVFNVHNTKSSEFTVIKGAKPFIEEKAEDLEDYININNQSLTFEVRDVNDEDD